MIKYLLLLLLLSLLYASDAYSQCEVIQTDLEVSTSAVAPTGRDFVMQYRVPNQSLIIEDHYTLYPRSQWIGPMTPYHAAAPYARWMDWDGDGRYNEWYSFSQDGLCSNAAHYIWDWDLEMYIPY